MRRAADASRTVVVLTGMGTRLAQQFADVAHGKLLAAHQHITLHADIGHRRKFAQGVVTSIGAE